MKRLTERDEYGNADIIGVDSADLQLNLEFDEFNRVTDALNRLAAYEDTGYSPEEIRDNMTLFHSYRHICAGMDPDRLTELCEAGRENRAVALPIVIEFGYGEIGVSTLSDEDGRLTVLGISGLTSPALPIGTSTGLKGMNWGDVPNKIMMASFRNCESVDVLVRALQSIRNSLTREEAEAALNEVRPTIQAEPKVAEESYQNVNNASLEGSGGK